jgi:flagellar biosynthesis protein FliR
MPFFNFSFGEIERGLLIFARVAGIFGSAPILSSPRIPLPPKVGLALMMALVLFPVVGGIQYGLPTQVPPFIFLVLKEALVGLVIGFVANLLFTAIHIAGQLIDMQTGFAFAGIIDPNTGNHSAIAGEFQSILAWMLFLAVNGHHMLLNGVADSFRALPLGTFSAGSGLLDGVLVLSSRIFVIALQIGAPVVGAVLLSDLGLALLSRTIPQMNVFVLGFPIKMALGLIVLLLSLPYIGVIERHLFTLIRAAISHFTLLGAAG